MPAHQRLWRSTRTVNRPGSGSLLAFVDYISADTRKRLVCQILPITPKMLLMSTMNISLPDSLKSFVDEQVVSRGYGTSSEYVRELIRRDADRLKLRGLLMEGAASNPTAPNDAKYFGSLRERVQGRSPSIDRK